jgi:hypothetical protein
MPLSGLAHPLHKDAKYYDFITKWSWLASLIILNQKSYTLLQSKGLTPHSHQHGCIYENVQENTWIDKWIIYA